MALLKMTPGEVQLVRDALNAGLKSAFGDDRYVYYIADDGSDLSWHGFNGNANNGINAPYVICPEHNSEAWEAYLAGLEADETDPDLTLHKIAKTLHSNYSYLSTQFAKALGISASRYITRFRMTKAAHALRQGKGNMIQIAGGVGYTDVKYFYRCFKKEFEMTPNQYLELLHKTEKQRA